jgi:hypothetical protein
MFNNIQDWADCLEGLIQVIKQKNMMHIVLVAGIFAPAHWLRENAALDDTDSVSLLNPHCDLDTY